MTIRYSKDTICVRSGTIIDAATGGVRSPLFPSTSNSYLDTAEDYYPRHGNLPNQRSLAVKLSHLEQGEDALLVGSGMSAIALSLAAHLKRGDHLVAQHPLYSGALKFITKHLKPLGVAFTLASSPSPADFERAIRPNTKAFYLESPTNPLLSIVDIRALVSLARKHGILTFFDNTLATPINQNPLLLGVDIVIHSATKFLGGHGDLSGGAIIGARHLVERSKGLVHDVGGYLDPNTCHLLERSLLTLSIRIERINANAQRLALFLNDHPNISRVHYPGLPCHPAHHIARSQMVGFGGVVSFELAAAIDPKHFQKRLRLITPANSLGEVVTTLNSPTLASSSYASLSKEQKLGSGINDSLVRMSVGIESFDDLRDDLDAALGNK